MASTPITTTVAETRRAVARARQAGKSIALVPTMGALHAGHVSLIGAARKDAGFVAVSVFVNPTQFGPSEDFQSYPRPFDKDVKICESEGVDLIFHPDPKTLYPAKYHTFVEVHGLQDVLCGKSRPGHFRGVATVVLKLFNIVQPDTAYFGQKDAQQARLIEQMVQDLNVPVRIKVQPIFREADGLALSSRNVYLDAPERQNATILCRTLREVQDRAAAGAHNGPELVELMKSRIAATGGAALDYAAIVDYDTLQPVQELRGHILVALAVRFGRTRLIDNILLNL